ncbi:hypothetical protein, partial [Microseira wollei]|uniref:hypothetical protein n=1 Tax=Microseira wollei TaxID=467598 RepID=UPI001CFD3552
FSNLWYKPKFILRRAPWAFIQVVLTRHFPTFGINQNLFYAVPLGIYTSCIDTAFSNLWYKPKFILRRAPWAFIQVVLTRHFPT